MSKLKIAIVQLNPQIGQLKQTEKRAWSLLQNLKTQNKHPDLIIFPEFALTGYSFHSRPHIDPHLEDIHNKSKTAQTQHNLAFAASVAKDFQCYTVLGYPEASYHNSAMVVSPSGQVLHNYRKHFTYDTDDEWNCVPGAGFTSFPLSFPVPKTTDTSESAVVKCSVGICMDMNPDKFDDTKFNNFDFSSHCADSDVQLVIVPTAWLHALSVTKRTEADEKQSGLAKIKDLVKKFPYLQDPDKATASDIRVDIQDEPTTLHEESTLQKQSHDYDPSKPDRSTVDYWMLRFFPFLYNPNRSSWFEFLRENRYLQRTGCKSYLGVTESQEWGFEGKETVLCICDRTGVEEDSTVYAGSSGIYKFNGKSFPEDGSKAEKTGICHPGVEVYGILPQGQEGLLYREVELNLKS
ncbi:hypothetical protein ACO0QE_003271 [Hanseniaspora vineae]